MAAIIWQENKVWKYGEGVQIEEWQRQYNMLIISNHRGEKNSFKIIFYCQVDAYKKKLLIICKKTIKTIFCCFVRNKRLYKKVWNYRSYVGLWHARKELSNEVWKVHKQRCSSNRNICIFAEYDTFIMPFTILALKTILTPF